MNEAEIGPVRSLGEARVALKSFVTVSQKTRRSLGEATFVATGTCPALGCVTAI